MILTILPSISMKFWPNQYISFKVDSMCGGADKVNSSEIKLNLSFFAKTYSMSY